MELVSSTEMAVEEAEIVRGLSHCLDLALELFEVVGYIVLLSVDLAQSETSSAMAARFRSLRTVMLCGTNLTTKFRWRSLMVYSDVLWVS